MKNEFMVAGIYKIQNKVNNKIYIGSSFNINESWDHHLRDLCTNNYCNKEMQSDFNKYGITNFTFGIVKIIDTDDKNELVTEEQLTVNKYDFKELYNRKAEI